MKIAVIKTGGKQYKVVEGQRLKVEKLKAQEGSQVEFDQVLLVADDKKTEVGTPVLAKKVSAKVIKTGRAKKVSVGKYKAKIRYDKVVGHRQPFTEVEIEKIG